MQKISKKSKPTTDLMVEIMDLQRSIYRKAEERGLSRYLSDHGTLTVRPHDRDIDWSADVELRFQPNHGIEYKLKTMVTRQDGAWPIDQAALSDQFIEYLEYIRERAEAVSASRRAIKAAAIEVIAEAAGEGISLELVRIEPTSVLICGGPDRLNRRGRFAQVFYVHIIMPHDDQGTLTEDVYTIDADEPEEFASYLRDRLLPELRELLNRFAEPILA